LHAEQFPGQNFPEARSKACTQQSAAQKEEHTIVLGQGDFSFFFLVIYIKQSHSATLAEPQVTKFPP
jgi:hypothetical protein